jgi:hypothetical protein
MGKKGVKQKKKEIGDQFAGYTPHGQKTFRSPYQHYTNEQVCRLILTYWHFMMERDWALWPNKMRPKVFSSKLGSFNFDKRKQAKKFLYEYKENQKVHKAETTIDKISEQLHSIYFDFSHEVLLPYVYRQMIKFREILRKTKNLGEKLENEVEQFFKSFHKSIYGTGNDQEFSRWYSPRKERILKIVYTKTTGKEHDTVDLACKVFNIAFENRNLSATKVRETIKEMEDRLKEMVDKNLPEPAKGLNMEGAWIGNLLEFSFFNPSYPNFHLTGIHLIEYLLIFFGIHPELREKIIGLIDHSIHEKPQLGKQLYETNVRISTPVRNKKTLK